MSDSPENDQFRRFRESAEPTLKEFARSALPSVTKTLSGGTWHPYGFAIWYLHTVPQLGKLRLHVWPDENRKTRPWGPRIHRHGWHLASLVLTGTYRDVLYSDSAEHPGPGDWRPVAPYRVEVLPGNKRRITPEDGTLYIRQEQDREVDASDMHYIPAGKFHETLIPSDEFVATLVLLGHEQGVGSSAVEDQRLGPRVHQRSSLADSEAERILDRLQARLRASRPTR
ncbi:hypothetical protein [Actinoallomurus iriomotensis]|uniref:Cupin domain-containing protein n=1 Tax=Actinoallomurus iriomotensis TaxID=478107 RepID=A0A9W6RSJ0_9ACTN|nr:hypothetical protein [Actinoallomurus iriomotensis]GLY79135.1 hypothetical protein Airi01_074020 [Actinoallomurus iriomotensis]